MILEWELQMTSTVAYDDSLNHVGRCSIARAMILARSGRLGGLAIASVDGCYLYIIIHYCILCVTWL